MSVMLIKGSLNGTDKHNDCQIFFQPIGQSFFMNEFISSLTVGAHSVGKNG